MQWNLSYINPKESRKIGNIVAKGKWRSNLLIDVVGFNRTWILDKSFRKSNELYFRVANCRSAINTKRKYLSSQISVRPKYWGLQATRGVVGEVRRRRLAGAAGRCGWLLGGWSNLQGPFVWDKHTRKDYSIWRLN